MTGENVKQNGRGKISEKMNTSENRGKQGKRGLLKKLRGENVFY
jgi:hypothetical protein